MPGIFGLITKKPRQQAEQELGRMLGAVRHEAFYSTGTWVDEGMGLYVGWAVRQDTYAESVPLRSEKGDTTLVFSGEEFPARGTGPSHLMRLSEEDPQFPASLNGRFHGLLADRTRRTAMLFNDRFGMSRIYYHESREAFYFAAEAKAILAVRPELRSVDPQGLGEFVACGCTLENRTLYRGVHILPPGSAWLFRDGAVDTKNHYFQPREWEEQAPLEPDAFYRELREVFTGNLPRYFNGAEPIGMSLTAGLDTRAIMAWHKSAPGSLPCYSFGGMFRDCHDVVLARRVAASCRQPHQVIRLGDDFLSQFAHHAERTVYLTDGCSDVSQAPDLYANQRARQIAPVRMTGNYGGEVLRGVRLFKAAAPTPGIFHRDFVAHVDSARATHAGLRKGHPLSFFLFRQAPWHHYGRLALEQSQLSLRSPYLDNDLVRTAFRAPAPAATGQAICLRLIAEGNAELQRIPTDMGLLGDAGPTAAIASRGLLRFTHKAEYAYDYGMPRWLAPIDRFLSPLRPERLFLGRHKFYHFRLWYRDALSQYVADVLLDPRSLSRPYLERRGVESAVLDHIKGNRNYTSEIHKLLTLELLHRLFVD